MPTQAQSAGLSAGASSPAVPFAPDPVQLRLLTERTADLCYSAVKTIAVLPDREHAWLYRMPGGSPPPVMSLDDIWREWGADVAAQVRKALIEESKDRRLRYLPKPEEVTRCLDVLAWLTWLEREHNGQSERRIICARAFEVSFRALAKRFGKSDDTIRRWEAAGFRAILGEYHVAIEAMG